MFKDLYVGSEFDLAGRSLIWRPERDPDVGESVALALLTALLSVTVQLHCQTPQPRLEEMYVFKDQADSGPARGLKL